MLIIRVKRLLELKWESKKKERRDSILLALFVVDRKGNSEKLGGWFSRYPLLLFLRGSWDGKASGLLSMGGMWFLLLYFQSLVGWCNLNRVSVKYSIFFLFFIMVGRFMYTWWAYLWRFCFCSRETRNQWIKHFHQYSYIWDMDFVRTLCFFSHHLIIKRYIF